MTGFAGGTTDGPGDPPFHQHFLKPLPLFELVRAVLEEVLCTVKPKAADYACHAPKPVLLPTGFMDGARSIRQPLRLFPPPLYRRPVPRRPPPLLADALHAVW